MKNTDRLDRLFTSGQRIPTEVDLSRIERIVADFPGGPAPGDPNHLLPKLLTVTALVATATLLWLTLPWAQERVTVLSIAQPSHDNPGWVSSPGASNKLPTRGDAPLLISNSDSDTVEWPMPIVRPSRVAPLPTTELIAAIATDPAGLPPHLITTTDPAGPNAAAAELPTTSIVKGPRGDLTEAATAVFTETILSGNWEWSAAKDEIYLSIREKIGLGSVTWRLPLKLSAAEVRVLSENSNPTFKLPREVGRIIFMSDTEEFSFQLDAAVSDEYETNGWGTTQAREADVKFTGTIRNIISLKGRFTRRPSEILWLKYFINRVGEDYRDELHRLGLDDQDLNDLWRLPNEGIGLDALRHLRDQADRVNPAGKIPGIADLLLLYEAGGNMTTLLTRPGVVNLVTVDTLEELKDYGFRGVVSSANNRLSLRELTQLKDAKLEGFEIRGYTEAAGRSLSATEIIALKATGLEHHEVKRYNDNVGRELSAAELTRLKDAEVESYDIRYMRARGFTGTTVEEILVEHRQPTVAAGYLKGLLDDRDFPGERPGWIRETVYFDDIEKLEVDGDIRLIVIPGAVNKATISRTNQKRIGLSTERNKRGVLRIERDLPFGWVFKNFITAEILLTVAGDLEKVSASDRAEVVVDPRITIRKTTKRNKAIIISGDGQ